MFRFWDRLGILSTLEFVLKLLKFLTLKSNSILTGLDLALVLLLLAPALLLLFGKLQSQFLNLAYVILVNILKVLVDAHGSLQDAFF